MTYSLVLVFFLVTLAYTGCVTAGSNSGVAHQKVDYIESAVYSAVLDEYEGRIRSRCVRVLNETVFGVVSPEGSREKVMTFLKEHSSIISPDLIKAFAAANSTPTNLEPDFPIKATYVMVTREELMAMEDAADGPGACAGGVLSISRVGLSENGDEALVYLGYQTGSRSGWGQYVFLKLESGRWRVAKKISAWIS